MNKNILFVLSIVLVGGGLAAWLMLTPPSPNAGMANGGGHGAATDADEPPKGPHNGRLLRDGDFALEVTVFEKGVPPEFHVYAYHEGKPVPPDQVAVQIELTRLDGQVDTFRFQPQGDYLRGDGVVTEPHSFDVDVTATYRGERHEWHYENHEGRVRIAADVAAATGIETERAGPRTIEETLKLTGRVRADPGRLSHLRARFPGVVERVLHDVGDRVGRGDVLAHVQSNESLQSYRVRSPIGGHIVQRSALAGEPTGDNVLFTIADLSTVWVEFDVFARDTGRVRAGQSVIFETLDGESAGGKIDWLSPLADPASQSIRARVILENTGDRFRPGQFVRSRVTVAEHDVPLAVRRSGIQSFRDFQVVYARVGDVYEVRMLELGRGDGDWVEVLGGLKPGTEYVTGNSYLIKADIEKSGAVHDH